MFGQYNVDGQKTFYGMYREIVKIYEGLKNKVDLDFDMINRVFAIDKRSDIDLVNIRDFILAITLLGEGDILKAQLRGDKETEKAAIAKHNERCALMSILSETIGSEMES